jgi:hypothetical protein
MGSWATAIAVCGDRILSPYPLFRLLYEQFEAFQITLLSPFWAGIDPALVDQNIDRVEPGNFALEFVVMSLHELIQFVDRDTFGMLTHQAKNQLDGTILLGKFSTVRHVCSFCLRFFSRYLRWGTRGLKLFRGYRRRRADGSMGLTVGFRTADYKAVNQVLPVGCPPSATRNGSFTFRRRSTPQSFSRTSSAFQPIGARSGIAGNSGRRPVAFRSETKERRRRCLSGAGLRPCMTYIVTEREA